MSCRKSHPSPTLLPKQSQPYSYSILSSHFTPAWEPSMLYPQSLKRLFYTLLACIQCHQSQYPIQIFDSMGQSLTVFNSMGQSLTRWVGCLGDDHDQQGSFFLCFSFLICSATCCLLTGMLFELCCTCCQLELELLSIGNLALTVLCHICWILLNPCYRFDLT